MASEETGVPLEDRRAQEHRATEGPKTEVPASPSQDRPQVIAGNFLSFSWILCALLVGVDI